MARDTPSGGAQHTSRDERWLLAAPRSTSLANRGNSSSPSQAYADLEADDGRLDEYHRRQSSQRGVNGVSASKSRAVYFDDSQQYVRSTSASRDIGQRESPIIGELKTNVIIKDEFTLVTDLSYHLANRYNRPESCVMIKVDHSACLALGGVFDPCYILTISALPFQLSSTSNRRNAAIIQAFMADILSVPADRGIVKFQPVDEGSMAMNGTTMVGETERNEKRLYEDDGTSIAVRRAITQANRKSLSASKKATSRGELSPSHDAPYKKSYSALERAELERRRRSIPEEPEPPSPEPHDPMPNVFELPATESRSPTLGEDAATPTLVIDNMTQEELLRRSAKLPNGRPQTVGATELDPDDFDGATSDNESRRKAIARLSQPVISSAMARISAAERFSQGLRPEQKSLLSQAMPPNISFRAAGDPKGADHSMSVQGNESSAARAANSARQFSPPLDDKFESKVNAQAADKLPRETGANVAKRRSTMTATPNLPAPPQPAEPQTKTSSIREPKGIIGKRKSFLSAFRRSTHAHTAPA